MKLMRPLREKEFCEIRAAMFDVPGVAVTVEVAVVVAVAVAVLVGVLVKTGVKMYTV
jgi:hypothetical protein